MSAIFANDHIIVTLGKRSARVPCRVEDDVVVVSLDDLGQWQPPPGEEVSIEDLGRIAAEIEKVGDAMGLVVEFE